MSEAASALSGEAPAAEAPVTTEAPAAAAPTAGNDENWLSGLEDSTREFLDNKGWSADNPAESITRMTEGYRNAEKLIGGRVKIPEQGDEDGWKDLFKRLGTPDDPQGYELRNLPEEQDPKMVEFYRSAAHKARLTPQQADVFLSEYNNFNNTQIKTSNTEITNGQMRDIESLRAEWGPNYDENVAMGRRSVKAAEGALGEDGVDLIESAIGTARTLKLFAALGKQFSEDNFVDGETNGEFGMSATKAQAQLQARKDDPQFMARYMRGDKDAESEFSRLMAASMGGPAR